MNHQSMPKAEELAALESFARDVLEGAGVHALAYFRRQPEVIDKALPEADLDPVTLADRAVEDHVRAAILARHPGHGIVGEEGEPVAGRGDLAWTIDPIDGTRGFIAGFVHWAALLALTFRGRPLLGVVHQPYTGETWSGSVSGGARFSRTGEAQGPSSIRCRPCAGLFEATLATTDPYLFHDAEAEAFHGVRGRVRLTRYGADCYAYCMLAMGQLDLVVESGLKPWDVQALIPLVTAAGGVITDWRGGDCSAGGQVVAAGDPRTHRAALELLGPAAG